MSIFRAVALALLAGVALCVAWVLAMRAGHPGPLEWLEANLVAQSWGMAQGSLPYQDPSAGHVAHVYPPLLPALLSAVFRSTGPSFAAAHLLSLAATLATLPFLVGMARSLGAGRAAIWVVPALYLAGFRATGEWFDTIRVDPWMVLFLVAGTRVALEAAKDSLAWTLIAALSLSLAVWSKQTALPLAVLALLLGLRWQPRRMAAGLAALALFLIVPGWWLQIRTDGWFSWYTITVPSSHPLTLEHLRVLVDVESGLALVLLAVLGLLAPQLKRSYVAMGVATFAVCCVSLCKQGAFLNVLLPAWAMLVPAAAATLTPRDTDAPHANGLAMSLLMALCLASAINPGGRHAGGEPRHIPGADGRTAVHELVDWLSRIEGPVFVPEANGLATLAGHEPGPHDFAISEVVFEHGLKHVSAAALLGQEYDVLVLGPDTHPKIREACLTAYRMAPPGAQPPHPVTHLVGVRRHALAEVLVPRDRTVHLPSWQEP